MLTLLKLSFRHGHDEKTRFGRSNASIFLQNIFFWGNFLGGTGHACEKNGPTLDSLFCVCVGGGGA